MTAPTDDRIEFPEPRRCALRAMLVDLTAPHRDEGGEERVDMLVVGPITPRTDILDLQATATSRRRLRRLAAVGVALAAAAAVVAAAVVLPGGRDHGRVEPAGPSTTTSSTAPSPAHSGLYVPSVASVRGGQPAEAGWTVSSCPYLDGVDPAALLGVSPGVTWSGISTPVRCRVYTPAGAPLLDITTFGNDGPGAAADAADELRAGASDVQAPETLTGDPALGSATVTSFRTTGLSGREAGWAATVTQGSTTFLVRAAHGVEQTAVERVVSRVVDVATGPGGSALTASLRLCSHDLGSDFSRAFIGGQVTCSFGGDHATDISVQYSTCPDGSNYIVFWSTAEDATDHATYYGSQSGQLQSSPEPPSLALTISKAQSCR